MLRVQCPAKVNLFLAVGAIDAHGYHPIRTIFQAIGLFDTLEIEARPGAVTDFLDCDWPELPPENTLTKTLRLLRELAPVPPLAIRLVKRIPDQTGLGGGSSDAAGLLRAASRLVSGPIPDRFLLDVAASVGKDVPFFLIGGRAKGEGYGEILAPLPDEEKKWLVVVRPSVGCATGEAYSRLDQLTYPFLPLSENHGLYNDFERVAPGECLELIERLMAYGAEGALLCGSGSGAFGVFPDETSARMAQHRLNEDSRVQTWTVPTLSRLESLVIQDLDSPAVIQTQSQAE